MKVIHTNENMIARSLSFLWWKRIYVGTKYWNLLRSQKEAVLAHEEGHCKFHHTELRLLTLLFCPVLIKPVCHKTEFAADRYAASKGLAKPLSQVLSFDREEDWLYPCNTDRRKALENYEYPRMTPVKC